MSHRKISVVPLVVLALAALLGGCVEQRPPSGPMPRAMNEPQPTYLEHTITFSGETLADIAAWYTGKATNWQMIRDANPNVKPNNLKLGQTILIPRSLVINDRPFTKTSLKRVPSKTPEVSPTPGSSDNEPMPASTPASGPELGTPSEPVPTPVATEAPAAPTPVATSTPSAGPSSDDLEREKLLDELLK